MSNINPVIDDSYYYDDYYEDFQIEDHEETVNYEVRRLISNEETQENVVFPATVVLNNNLILVNVNQETFTYYNTHEHFDKLTEIVMGIIKTSVCTEEQFKLFKTYSSLKEKLIEWGSGFITIKSNQIYYKNELIDNVLTQFLLHLSKNNDKDLQYWCNFLDTVQNCSSSHVYERLFLFISQNDLAISKDGKSVFAWKIIRNDYKDKYTGTIDNSVGQYVSMPAHKVTSDPNIHCSSGLHVASLDYLRSCYAGRGDRLIIVKVNIDDIISIPNDYQGSKIRVKSYLSVKEVGVWGEEIDPDKQYNVADFLGDEVGVITINK